MRPRAPRRRGWHQVRLRCLLVALALTAVSVSAPTEGSPDEDALPGLDHDPSPRELSLGDVESDLHAWLARAYLTGTWGGMRTRLAHMGISPTLTYVTDVQGNPVGGRRQALRHFDNVGLDVTLELDKLRGWSGAEFHTSFSWRGGESLSDRDIGNVFNVAQECCGPTYRLVNVELVYRGPIPGRDRDIAAVGAVYGLFSKALRRSQRDARRADPAAPAPQTWELALELTYIVEVTRWLQVQPDVQVILNPGGTGRIPDALVLGVQVSVTF